MNRREREKGQIILFSPLINKIEESSKLGNNRIVGR